MSLKKITLAHRERLKALMHSWGDLERKIKRKKKRVKRLGPVETLPDSMLGKLRRILQQIAIFSEKERDIISEINEVERKHQALRKGKRLKRIRPKPVEAVEHPYLATKDDEETEENKDIFWWLLLIFFLLTRRHENNKANAPSAG